MSARSVPPLAALWAAPVMLLAAGCGETAPAVADIVAADLLSLHREGRVHIVDVREADEFASGHIPGAISRPLSSFDCRGLEAPAGKEIVLQCRSGRRSAEALEICARQGRTDIARHLAGGVLAWRSADGPLTVPSSSGIGR